MSICYLRLTRMLGKGGFEIIMITKKEVSVLSDLSRLYLSDEEIEKYADDNASVMGRIGSNVTIVDSGYIKNVKIGDNCKIEGAGRLKNGSLKIQ